MHLLIDGYNLLYVGRSSATRSSSVLERERDLLVRQLSAYRQSRPCDITVVFDGWQAGSVSEERDRVMGIERVYSKLGEKADDVIKRIVREKGAGITVITSDREIATFAERMDVSVVSSAQFKEKVELAISMRQPGGKNEEDEEESGGQKKKGPSRRLSKKERKAKAALKKL